MLRRLRLHVLAVLTLAFALVPQYAHAAEPTFGHAALVVAGGEPMLQLDGKPFFFLGGAFFYERIPRSRWRDAMQRMREIGANTLDLYVPWNWHELADGDFDFDGRTSQRRDLREVLRLGKELGFFFIVRPGPVIRNEWRNGGYPAWLLERPEYGMPLHDVLEGRYPATATLQNQHGDDAAAEWMRNATHMRYASRWLHRALEAFRPVADRVLAVQLDDDQGAYLDNDTYPAPHLHAYLDWLQAQVRDVVGPVTPTFINTFEMKVPSSSPVWAMGNWYQSDAYTIGEHDRAELAFATATLRTQARVPLAYSEFQAGWLAGPEDPQPRPADPTNTSLALGELTGWGLKGLIDFPLLDTLAPFGWEAPFSNALYDWDAAYDLAGSDGTGQDERGRSRWSTTRAVFGALRFYGPALEEAHRVAGVAVPYDGRGDVFAAAALLKGDLATCRRLGITCAAIDPLAVDDARLRAFRTVVVHGDGNAPLARRARALGVAVVSDVAQAHAARLAGVTLLRGAHGTFAVVENWTDRERTLDPRTFGSAFAGLSPFRLAPRDVRIVAAGVSPTFLDARFRDPDRFSATCPVGPAVVPDARGALTAETIVGDVVTSSNKTWCTFDTVRNGHTTHREFAFNGGGRGASIVASAIALGPNAGFDPPAVLPPPVAGRATATLIDYFGDGQRDLVLRNSRTGAVIVPDGGARAIAFGAQERTDAHEATDLWSNAFDATGALRDDVAIQPPPSPTDRIAKYTHSYPAGMFNRPYAVCTFDDVNAAGAYLAYDAPDVAPSGARFERTIALASASDRLIVDERLTAHAGSAAQAQRLVSLSALARPEGTLDDGTGRRDVRLPATIDVRRGQVVFEPTSPGAPAPFTRFRRTDLLAVSWVPGSVEQASWTPARSNGTLRLVFAPGWRRIVFRQGTAGDAANEPAFAEAEREWVAANPGPSKSGEVAKWYTQSPQKRPSESSCGFESHLPQ